GPADREMAVVGIPLELIADRPELALTLLEHRVDPFLLPVEIGRAARDRNKSRDGPKTDQSRHRPGTMALFASEGKPMPHEATAPTPTARIHVRVPGADRDAGPKRPRSSSAVRRLMGPFSGISAVSEIAPRS